MNAFSSFPTFPTFAAYTSSTPILERRTILLTPEQWRHIENTYEDAETQAEEATAKCDLCLDSDGAEQAEKDAAFFGAIRVGVRSAVQ